MKNILLCNDDGVNSTGILAAADAVDKLGKTIIVGPSKQQSGIGHALTLFEPLRIDSVNLKNNKKGYAVSGTPTDAAILGIFEILDEKPDLFISGINIGYNLGKAELTTSGTLGAAMESASYGIPTIAVSQEVKNGFTKFESGHVDVDFSFAMKILKRVSKLVLNKGLPQGVDLINLNIPINPKSDKIKIVNLGERMFLPQIETRYDPRGKPYYWIDGLVYENDIKETDGYCIKNDDTCCITPLSLNFATNLDLMVNWLDK